MKIATISSLLIILVSISAAQIPNSGFENWSGGEPVDWFTSNVPGTATPVTQSSTARSGSSALRGEVVAFPVIGALQPVVQSGTDAEGFPISARHATFSGYYRFSPQNADKFSVVCLVAKNGTSVGGGAIEITAAAATYTQFNVDIQYITDDTPDTCIVQFQIVGPNGSDFTIGSYVLIDDLSFSGLVTSADGDGGTVPLEFGITANYPNPFNGITNFGLTVAEKGFVDVRVYDILGREVAVLVHQELAAGTHPLQWNSGSATSGVFLIRAESHGKVEMRKIVLAK